MAKIEHITDKHREIIYPFTKERAIYDDNGVNLPEKLATFVTRSVNDLINYYTKTETYTKAQVDELIRGIRSFSYEVVSELPSASASTMWKFYLVPSADPQTQNVKDEFITIDNGVSANPRYTWEQIGSTAIDLSGYVTSQELTTALSAYTTTADLTTLLAGKQDAAVSKTWEQLKTLRDSSQLSPGTKYRITDYVATTIQTDTRSANHPFDIIVTAETASSLSEDASAAIHTGDTYFSGASANLAAWRVSYCLDNDTTRFSWADATNGKGVIYRLVDEWENDFPYDFKGIQFKRYYVTGVTSTYSDALSPLIGLPIAHSSTRGLTKGSEYEWYYTFAKLGNTWADEATDASFDGLLVQRNKITSSQYDSSGVRKLNNVVFMGGKAFYDFIIAVDPNANIDGSYLYFDNIFDGESIINNTIIGFACLLRSSFAFRHNTIVGAIRHSHFGGNFSSNTLFITRDCSHVTYGIAFDSNVFRFSSFSYCSVSNYCKGNYIYCTGAMQVDSFGEYFGYNTFVGDSITFCRFGNGFIYNTFSNANLTTSQFDGQINNCEFQGDFKSDSFGSILSYIIFVGGTNGSTFGAVDVLGSIRGTSSAKIRIENSAFIVANVTDTRRRISLEADADGKLVASWYDEGQRVGIMKAVADAEWTPLSLPYFKPVTGIPASDLADGVIPDISGKEDTSNKSQSVETDKSSTTKYPSTKAVWDELKVRPVMDETSQETVPSLNLENTANKSQGVQTDRGSTIKYPSVKAVFDSLGKWGVVSQNFVVTGNNTDGYDLTATEQEYGLIPQSFIDRVNNYHSSYSTSLLPKFNEETGYFELNGLTDIAYDEMQRIFNFGDFFRTYTGGDMYIFNYTKDGKYLAVRTLLPTTVAKNVVGSFIRYNGLVTLRISLQSYIGLSAANIGYAFYNNMYFLREIQDVIKITGSGSFGSTCFSDCIRLESVKINGLKTSTSFYRCKHLSLESVLYMVNNAANTTAITITLHATAYARCQADTTEYTYNSQTYTGILAYASAKNITIASA